MEERPRPETDLENLIAGLEPELLAGTYVFVELPDGWTDRGKVLASVREPEGLSAVMSRQDADDLRLPYDFVAAWITLRVKSALDAVGLTAEVSRALADEGIGCNVIAGLHHDHLLVPAEEGERAVSVLRALTRRGSR